MIAILGRSTPADPAVARRMLAAAPHRGSHITLRALGNCIVGVANRPDFVDSSVSTPGSVIAALAGGLDNLADLHTIVTAAGFPAASPAAADVIVAAFRAFGPDAPNRMRGTFAGVVTDGRTVWLRDFVTVSKADNGSNRLQGVMVDITDRVEAMNDLAASQMRTQLLLEQIPAVEERP